MRSFQTISSIFQNTISEVSSDRRVYGISNTPYRRQVNMVLTLREILIRIPLIVNHRT